MNKSTQTSFAKRVVEFVNKIPHGTVVSYGQVAAACGSPNAARIVGGILSKEGFNSSLPWWRVVSKSGYLSIRGHETVDKDLQAAILRNEGVEVSKDFVVDLKVFGYKHRDNLSDLS